MSFLKSAFKFFSTKPTTKRRKVSNNSQTTTPNTNTNLGTRITAPQKPDFRFKRRKVSNNSQKTPGSNVTRQILTRSQTKTPRSLTRNNNQTKTPRSVTRNNNQTKTPLPKVTKKNVIKMFNNKSQYISNNKSENIPRALKYISKSQLLTGTSIKRQKIPFNKLNE